MAPTKYRFTPTNQIMKWQSGDKMGKMIGYVAGFEQRSIASNCHPVSKIVVDNGEGTQVQIVAWGDPNIKRLMQYSDVDTIVKVTGCTVIDLTGKKKFNKGNVDLELRFGLHSKIDKLGEYEVKKTILDTPTIKDWNRLSRFSGKIQIEGYVLNPFRLMKSLEKSYGMGSIIDPEKKFKIEIRILNFEEDEYSYGQKVQVKGFIHKRYYEKKPEPVFFQIESPSDVQSSVDTILPDPDFLFRQYDYIK